MSIETADPPAHYVLFGGLAKFVIGIYQAPTLSGIADCHRTAVQEDDVAFWNRLVPSAERPEDEEVADLGVRAARLRAADEVRNRAVTHKSCFSDAQLLREQWYKVEMRHVATNIDMRRSECQAVVQAAMPG